MKTRIIFVDDDPMLLASTRRQLRRKLPDCDLLFFEKATEALNSMAESPADVVLSDLRMPEMDGAELLAQIAELYPDTVRLAWTGQSEVDQLNRVFESAHQIFSKPCPTEALLAIVTEAIIASRQPISDRRPLLPKVCDDLNVAFTTRQNETPSQFKSSE